MADSGAMRQDRSMRQSGKRQILIVEDDTALASGLCRALQNEETQARYCGTLHEAGELLADRQAAGEQYALVLLDVNLPDGNGFDLLQDIKKKYDVRVMMLTANDMEADIVAGLEMGADDYITKPFSLAVLRARVMAQFRQVRTELQADLAVTNKDMMKTEQVAVIDEYCFDFTRMLFTRGEERLELSKTEQRLLRLLVENRGITLTREQLLERVWSVEAEFVDENALSVTIKRLRDKLGAQKRIKTVYGIGYRWE